LSLYLFLTSIFAEDESDNGAPVAAQHNPKPDVVNQNHTTQLSRFL